MPTTELAGTTQEALNRIWAKVQRRISGREPGYHITLNPEVEAARAASGERIDALETSLEALEGVYSRETNSAVKTLHTMLAYERDVLANLPEVETVLAPGPNPDPFGMTFRAFADVRLPNTSPSQGGGVTFPVDIE